MDSNDATAMGKLLVALRLLMLALWFAHAAPALADERAEVHLLLSEATPAYLELAEAFAGRLGNRFAIHRHPLASLQEEDLREMDRRGCLVVPVGSRAVRRAAASLTGKASVLALMVPRATMEGIVWAGEGGQRVSAVYLDQPLQRSLQLIGQLRPKAARVGVVLSYEGAAAARGLKNEAARLRFQLSTETADSPQEVTQTLLRMLPNTDVLLLLPDAAVVNEGSARLLLVASFRQQVPVVAFSRGLVNAGAVAAVVSDPADIGHEGAALAGFWNPATGHLPPARHASGFSVVLNRQVARSLGIEATSEEELRRRLADSP
jgi:ABC-type uncharacterized transport system substrate-binding protein